MRRSAKVRARDKGDDQARLGPFLAAAIADPSSVATQACRALGASEAAISAASDWLRGVPEPAGKTLNLEAMQTDMQDLRYKLVEAEARRKQKEASDQPPSGSD